MANPLQHASRLVGVPMALIDIIDGSPSGGKAFVLWNPPLSTGAGSGGHGKKGEVRPSQADPER